MKLAELLEGLEYECIRGELDKETGKLINDSRKIEEGCVFVCIKGYNFDGHKAVPEAVEKKAAAVIVSEEVSVPEASKLTVIKVADTREALALTSCAYFGHPSRRLKVIGVTGTKGKTTTTYLIKSILEHTGHKVGLIGTIEVIIGEERFPALNTTPESYVIQEYLKKMEEAGIDTVVMEVSSQGLMLKRTDGISFEIGIFTNIEPDHIGPNEHKDFDEYLYCKSLLFRQCRLGILNADSEYLEDVLKGHTCSVNTFGIGDKADIRAENINYVNRNGILGVEFDVSEPVGMHAFISSPGLFSVYNALCAIAVCSHFEVGPEAIKEALGKAHVKGRIEMVKISDSYTLMIDYAHNAMALKSLLTTLKAYCPKRLVCLFGCGGNRAKSRRYEMGEVSGQLADLTVITSDNPRFEEPLEIIADIKSGIEKTEGRYIEIPDRKEAIRYVIKNAEPGDLIVLAGKGHEDYQEIKGVKYPMDERVLIAEVVEELKPV
ncbi:MAG TPA: UDP-N-acetylmuramoyl-L-alanyl-D-glutamate--2,6-diaminopimelate ligase [Lachnospiraceae bacterium]|nr:UDP-N-acetylmuramoyl-L-alanyl-D-glutamate--2,6-diaminopimelate ligase [Lachnospiraceae bacterium]